jgi:hypothetical protein
MGKDLSSIFQDNDKVNVWYRFASNLEWSADLNDLILQIDLLESLAKDHRFIARMVRCCHERSGCQKDRTDSSGE